MIIFHKIIRRLKAYLLKHIIYPLINSVIELLHDDYIILSSSVSPVANNWGDDANEWLIKCINPSLRIVQAKYSWNLKHKTNYLCIGSIISWMANKRSIIWGSGVVYPDQKLKERPLSVLAVRGPLTREYLLSQGIQCPKIYGDPAMLFPLFYQPNVEKQYKIGIIPHFRDKNNSILNEIQKYRKDILIIDVENIKPWNKFIDDIYSCNFIYSSSLHGIIISDAYNIPNMWIEFVDGERKRFAFFDYYASIGKQGMMPMQITDLVALEELRINYVWMKPMIDIDKLMDVCPFKHV